MPQGKQPADIVCPKCSLKTKWPQAMRRHKKTCGIKTGAHPCTSCGNVYDSRASLSQHEKAMHHPRERPTFDCQMCDKRFAQKRNLTTHIKTHAPIELKFRCRICNKKFATKFVASRHEERCYPQSHHTLNGSGNESAIVDSSVMEQDLELNIEAAAVASPTIIEAAASSPQTPEFIAETSDLAAANSPTTIQDPLDLSQDSPPHRVLRPKRLTKLQLRKKLEEKIINFMDDGLYVKENLPDGKGRGVFASKKFQPGDFLCAYSGEIVSAVVANERAKEYEAMQRGSYMYYFKYNGKSLCIDSTPEPPVGEPMKFGRLINHKHSDDNPNVKTELFVIDQTPYLVFKARDVIEVDDELLYDYNDSTPKSYSRNPWLAPVHMRPQVDEWIRTNAFPLTQEEETPFGYSSQLTQ